MDGDFDNNDDDNGGFHDNSNNRQTDDAVEPMGKSVKTHLYFMFIAAPLTLDSSNAYLFIFA